MCLAIYKPKNIQIKRKYLRNGFDSNDDGAGFAVAINGKVQIFKGYFSFDSFYKAFKPYQCEAAIIHFRQATSGKTDETNCHPFSLLNERFALIHNGVLDIKQTLDKNKSDTWHFCELVLTPLLETNKLSCPAFKYVIESAIGSHNKLVLLRGDGLHVIFNEKSGHWHKGAWFSNDYYKNDQKWYDLSRYTSGYGTLSASNGQGGYGSNYVDVDWHRKSKTSREYWENVENAKEAFPDYVPSCDRKLEIEYIRDQAAEMRLMSQYEADQADLDEQ